jgi:hypothetical protein
MSGLVATGYTRYVSQNKRKTNKWWKTYFNGSPIKLEKKRVNLRKEKPIFLIFNINISKNINLIFF